MNALVIRPAGAVALEDNDQWEMRFEIRSAHSGRIYIISRNKKSQKWGCSCMGWKRWRTCTHLTDGCGLSLSEIHGNGAISDDNSHKANRTLRLRQSKRPN